MSESAIDRVPLRIPAGWTVDRNEFYELDAGQLSATDPAWALLSEDLLQLSDAQRELIVDVGWYPEAQREGRYAVKVVFGRDWGRPLVQYATNVLADIVARTEALLVSPPEVPIALLLQHLRDSSPERRARAATQLARREAVDTIDEVEQALGREKNPIAMDDIQLAMHELIRVRKLRGSAR